MKKILASILALSMITSLAACGKKSEKSSKSDEKSQQSTEQATEETTLTYSDIAEKCPYKFSLENYCISELGKYTMVLAKMGGDVEVQFTVEKVNDTDWKMDFSDAKCPALESKYAE